MEAAAAAAAAEAAGLAGFGRLWAGSLSANNGRTQGDENTIILDVRARAVMIDYDALQALYRPDCC